MVGDLALDEMVSERGADELGPVVGEHAGHGDTEAGELADRAVQEPLRDLGGARADENLADRPSGSRYPPR